MSKATAIQTARDARLRFKELSGLVPNWSADAAIAPGRSISSHRDGPFPNRTDFTEGITAAFADPLDPTTLRDNLACKGALSAQVNSRRLELREVDISRIILAHDCIAMNDDAGRIILDKDSTAARMRAAIAHNDTSPELATERRIEVNAGALPRG